MLFIQGVYRGEIPVYSQGTKILQENSKRRIMVYANGEFQLTKKVKKYFIVLRTCKKLFAASCCPGLFVSVYLRC